MPCKICRGLWGINITKKLTVQEEARNACVSLHPRKNISVHEKVCFKCSGDLQEEEEQGREG